VAFRRFVIFVVLWTALNNNAEGKRILIEWKVTGPSTGICYWGEVKTGQNNK
jgi:hypothetical protein